MVHMLSGCCNLLERNVRTGRGNVWVGSGFHEAPFSTSITFHCQDCSFIALRSIAQPQITGEHSLDYRKKIFWALLIEINGFRWEKSCLFACATVFRTWTATEKKFNTYNWMKQIKWQSDMFCFRKQTKVSRNVTTNCSSGCFFLVRVAVFSCWRKLCLLITRPGTTNVGERSVLCQFLVAKINWRDIFLVGVSKKRQGWKRVEQEKKGILWRTSINILEAFE